MIFSALTIRHKNIICQPLIERIDIEKYVDGVELVVVGGESDQGARSLILSGCFSSGNNASRQNVRFEFR